MAGNYASGRIDGPGVYGTISVGTTAVEAKVGASVEESRKVVTIQPMGNKVYYGLDSSVTTATGTRIFKNQILELNYYETVSIWLISDDAGGVDCRITEVS